jgi:hypothetical protein
MARSTVDESIDVVEILAIGAGIYFAYWIYQQIIKVPAAVSQAATDAESGAAATASNPFSFLDAMLTGGQFTSTTPAASTSAADDPINLSASSTTSDTWQ